ELLSHFDEKALASVCRLYGLPAQGGKDTLIGGVISFVQRTTTESLSKVLADDLKVPPQDSSSSPLELTNDNLLRTLQTCRFPKLLKSDRAARDLLIKQATGVFGRERIVRDRAVGRHVKTKVDIDVAERFGIIV